MISCYWCCGVRKASVSKYNSRKSQNMSATRSTLPACRGLIGLITLPTFGLYSAFFNFYFILFLFFWPRKEAKMQTDCAASILPHKQQRIGN
jgi:hypothetical protein